MKTDKNRLAINMVSQIFSFFINVAINFLLTSYIVNRLGEEIYGFVGLANNFTSYFTVFAVAVNGMLNRYVTIALSRNEYTEASTYFSSATICCATISLAVLVPSVVFCFHMERFLRVSPEYATDVQWLWAFTFIAFLITYAGSSFTVAVFASNRMDLASLRQLQLYGIRVVILLALFSLLAPRVWYVGFAAFICAVATIGINYRHTRRLTPQLVLSRKYFRFSAIKELTGVGIWSSVNMLSFELLSGLDLLIANLFINPQTMGILSVAKIIPSQLNAFLTMVANVFSPKMTILYGKGDMTGFIRETKFAMRVCGYLCAVPMIGFIVYCAEFFRLWMNTLPDAEISRIQILVILNMLPLSVGVFIQPLYNVNSITRKLRIPVLFSLGLGIASTAQVLLLLRYTSLGVYAIAGVSSVLILLRILFFLPLYASHVLSVKPITFYSPLLRGLCSIMVYFVLFQGVKALTPATSWLSLILSAGICGATGYSAGVFILFSKEEQRTLLSLLNRQIARFRN